MSFQQLPKLYLRGSMMNVTGKNLTKDQKGEIEKVIDKVWNDPNFQGSKYKFCEALKNTIGGEYKTHEAGEQEARIAIYRAAISVLYHDKKLNPSDRVRITSDPINRKKYFTNYLWMYLRQILRENKIPSIRKYPTISGPASNVAARAICALIKFKKEDYELKEGIGKHTISGINQNMWPLALTLDIKALMEQYKEYGVELKMGTHKIIVSGSKDDPIISGTVVKNLRVKEISFDYKPKQDQDIKYTLEFKLLERKNEITSERRIEDTDSIRALKEKIPEDIKPIVDIITNPPEAYIQKYGDGVPKKCHISRFLDIPIKEVDNAFRMLRIHSQAMGLAS